MYKIRKEFACSCMHQLACLPKDHPCARVHGHNYVITVELQSETLNEVGFIKDYGELKPIKDWIDNTMDHRPLNDVFDFNPTAENMAYHIYSIFKMTFPQLHAVEVSETPKTSARYEE